MGDSVLLLFELVKLWLFKFDETGERLLELWSLKFGKFAENDPPFLINSECPMWFWLLINSSGLLYEFCWVSLLLVGELDSVW